eukprot:1784534-Prymnesium_polylepis.1
MAGVAPGRLARAASVGIVSAARTDARGARCASRGAKVAFNARARALGGCQPLRGPESARSARFGLRGTQRARVAERACLAPRRGRQARGCAVSASGAGNRLASRTRPKASCRRQGARGATPRRNAAGGRVEPRPSVCAFRGAGQ